MTYANNTLELQSEKLWAQQVRRSDALNQKAYALSDRFCGKLGGTTD